MATERVGDDGFDEVVARFKRNLAHLSEEELLKLIDQALLEPDNVDETEPNCS